MYIHLPIVPTIPTLYPIAEALASRCQLSVSLTPTFPLLLQLNEHHLGLYDKRTTAGPVYVDFVKGALGYRRQHGGGRQQPLAKAVGLKAQRRLTVVDATAGLGRDAFILAYLGCEVHMLERAPVIAALLFDGLQRAQQCPHVGPIIQQRLHGWHMDAQQGLSQWSPEVIYLDPMYPPRPKSASVKKEMQMLHTLVGADTDSSHLLQQALKCARHRVVVKRPQYAPPVEAEPSFCIHSKKTRFDVYLV